MPRFEIRRLEPLDVEQYRRIRLSTLANDPDYSGSQLPGSVPPSQRGPLIQRDRLSLIVPEAVGDGNLGGYYERPDQDMLAFWDEAVAEARTLERPWS